MLAKHSSYVAVTSHFNSISVPFIPLSYDKFACHSQTEKISTIILADYLMLLEDVLKYFKKKKKKATLIEKMFFSH